MDNLIVGIDTSCYTTSVACICQESIVLDERTVLSVPLGGRGLRQSDALFQHDRNLPELLERLFHAIDPQKIAAVGVSASPTAQPDSYMPVFLAGKLAAAAIAGARQAPMIETTHQMGHVCAALYGNDALRNEGRFLALHLSGGTTDVLLAKVCDGAVETLNCIGGGSDLHAGQMVDRIGVALGLPFPAGKHLEMLAMAADTHEVKLPSAVRGMQCSLSGAESAAQRLIASGVSAAEVAYGVYDCLARTVAKLICHAAQETGCKALLLSGGVASSSLLWTLLQQRVGDAACLYFGLPHLSSDNAVGVAFAAQEALCRKN